MKMTKTLLALILSLSLCAAGAAAQEPTTARDYVTERPSPLSLAVPAGGTSATAKFAGSVEISGRFLIAWGHFDTTREFLHVAFYPDAESAALLPRMTFDRPVSELFFDNQEAAVAMLLDAENAQRFHARELLHIRGEASIIIRDYQISVACDRRWYSVELVSVRAKGDTAVTARANGPVGCG